MNSTDTSADDMTNYLPPIAPMAMPHQVLQVASDRPSILQRVQNMWLRVAGRPA